MTRKTYQFNFLSILLALIALSISLPSPATFAAAIPRRVNIPYFATHLPWEQSAIFWFGQNKQDVPSRNYADVRVAYTQTELMLRVTVVDYYLWYKENPSASEDLTRYDAVAIYLDTQHDRAATPQTDDYMFLSATRHYPNDNASQYKRQARGNGSGWNTSWNGAWSDYSYMSWDCNPGPNSNTCGIDYGWESIFRIPYTSLGLSGPPSQGTIWGLGVLLYDRDDNPPAGAVAPDYWPPAFNANNPSTWGEMQFGYASYKPLPAVQEGVTHIRRATETDTATVADSWMGGGGWCFSGHEGHTEENHGDHPNLFVGTETAPTHFPCFNKSYLRFSLSSIPPGKVIISATLSLFLFGNAGDSGQAQPSWVHLFSIKESWNEMTIHWNNAPLPHENISATWLYPYSKSEIAWPGDEYKWDATKAVAEAYAAGSAVSLAIYGADTEQHSSKYLISSETGDWNIEGRPKLTVVWGKPIPRLEVIPSSVTATMGDTVTYTINILGIGAPLSLVNNLPAQVSQPGSISPAGSGASYDPGNHRVTWSGSPAIGQTHSFSYPVSITASGRQAIINTAVLTDGSESLQSSGLVILQPLQAWLPVLQR